MRACVIVGGGHNGLIAAFYLAKAGLKPLVLERRASVGGAASTEEIAPGCLAPSLAHALGPIRPSIVRDMQLAARVEFLRPDPRLVALAPDGRAIVFSTDRTRTADGLRAHEGRDADRYLEFCRVIERLGRFLAPIVDSTPPSLDGAGAGEVWELLKTGRRFRALGKQDGYRLLRWIPMPVADLVAEWFSSDLLQAAIAAAAVRGHAAGPWSAGTGAVLLLHAAFDAAPGGSSVTVRGGPGALAAALADAAREAGATIRTGVSVRRVLVRDGTARGVALEDGSEIAADVVVSNVDPRRTFLALIDPVELEPGFLQRIRNYRMRGTMAKVNLALSAVPRFTGVANPADLAGRIHIGPSIDAIERAFDAWKYGELSPDPYLDVTIPSILDPSLCRDGRHVMSVYVQFVPYEPAADSVRREAIASNVVRTLERYAPGIRNSIEQCHVRTPADLEQEFGLTYGDPLHGEPGIDQLFTMRPVLGTAQYRTPIAGLFLCGAGTHPGGGLTGAPGRNAAREIVKALRR